MSQLLLSRAKKCELLRVVQVTRDARRALTELSTGVRDRLSPTGRRKMQAGEVWRPIIIFVELHDFVTGVTRFPKTC